MEADSLDDADHDLARSTSSNSTDVVVTLEAPHRHQKTTTWHNA